MAEDQVIEIENDDDQSTIEADDTTASQNESISDDDTNTEHKNKSNWKKMADKLKAAEKALANKDRELDEVKTWANSLYDDEAQMPFTKKEAIQEKESNETLDDVVTFYQKYPEALELKDEILETMKEFWCDRNRAWKFVKSEIPETSKTKKDFNLWTKAPTIKKQLKDVSPEEALNLSKEQQSEWRKLKGWE